MPIFLKGSQFRIDRDYPKEITAARQRLWPRFKELKSQNKKVSLQYPARLVLNGRVIEDALPDWYEVLKADRIRPYGSLRVQAAKDRLNQRRGILQDGVASDQNETSYRAINSTTETGCLFRSEMRSIVNSGVHHGLSNGDRAESALLLKDSHAGEVSMSSDGEDDDDGDNAFYSGYV